MRIIKSARVALAVTLAAAFTIVAVPGAAQADPTIDAVCTGVEHATFDPGLRLFSQNIDLTSHIDYEECVTGPVDYGTSDISAEDYPVSCLTILDSGSATRVIVWNTSETSTVDYDYTYSQSGGQTVLVETGTVSAGKFAGSDVLETLTGGSFSTQTCLFAPGVTENTTVVSLTISH